MTTKFVKFAPENEVAAEAFAAHQEAWISVNAPGASNWTGRYPSGLRTLGPAYDIPEFDEGKLKRDTNMNLLVTYYASPFIYDNALVEPVPGEEAYREYGIIVDTPDFFQFPD